MKKNAIFNFWRTNFEKRAHERINTILSDRKITSAAYCSAVREETGRRLSEWLSDVKEHNPAFTQRDLASRLHMTEQHLCSVMKGKRSLTVDTAIAAVVNTGIVIDDDIVIRVRPEWLLALDDCKFLEEKMQESSVIPNLCLELVIRVLERDFYSRIDNNSIVRNGEILMDITPDLLDDIGYDIEEYCHYKISRLLKDK